jgi:uncharacterized protein YuzB (UPF0349 family)
MKVRLCEHNKGKGKIYRQLTEEYPDLDVKIKSCIKQCSSCGEKPTATVDKHKITAGTVERLYEKIAEEIKGK